MPDSGVHFHGKHPDRPPKGTSLATVGFYAARAAYAGAPWPNLSAITSRLLSFHDGPCRFHHADRNHTVELSGHRDGAEDEIEKKLRLISTAALFL
jgi:hypothetical protein